MSATALSVENLTVRYGHILAVDGVSLTVPAGSIVGLIGANGAGKSSLLRAISGVATKSGRVSVGERDITHLKPHKIARLGVAHVPEGRHVIGPLTVEENLLLSANAAGRSGRSAQTSIEEVWEVFPPLRNLRDRPSAALSGGEQQMLAFGRALTARPDFLLLDEPSMGLAPIMISAIFRLLSDPPPMVAAMGILLAEQSAVLALDVSSYAYVLSDGRFQMQGSANELKTNSSTLNAYLGIEIEGDMQ